MSTVPPEAAVTRLTTDEPIANLLFDYPGADIILRSQDSYHFRVPKTSIINSSPILGEEIRKHLDSSGATNAEVSFTAIPLPESGKILHCLLTFIFFVTPIIPSTHEETMELLSVAQRYQMETALIHIRGTVARQNPLPTQLEPALRIYVLAQKYGLRQEALQSARTILNYPMTIEEFDNKLDIMPGAFLYELWKYYKEVRAILASDLTEFRESGARGTLTGLRCAEFSASQIPRWLDQYIDSIGKSLNLFDTAELSIVMARHTKNNSKSRNCECASIRSQTIRDFWAALASVIHGSFEKVSVLSLVREHEDPQAQINPTIAPLEPFRVSDANLVIRSSDLVDFRVHKSVLALVSPFFEDLLSLPQPSDSETVDGLPMIRITEDSELLSCLVSILYPVPTVIPNSYEKVLYLLAACQKYDMDSVQSFIRAEVNRGEFPSPTGAEAFAAYAIASGKRLIPEMENAARLTLDHPMTFEILGEGLRSFEGWALRDLANFRKRCRDNLVACFESFLDLAQPPFNVWTSCTGQSDPFLTSETGFSPSWLTALFRKHLDRSREAFSKPFFNPQRIQSEYFSAFEFHITSYHCLSCTKAHALKGVKFCNDVEDKLTQALSENFVIHE